MKIDPYYQRRNVAHGSQFLAKLNLCGYSQGFAGEGASNESAVVENGDFRLLYPLYLPNVHI